MRSVLFGAALKSKNGMRNQRLCNVCVVAMSGFDGVRMGLCRTVASLATLDIGLAGECELGMIGLAEFDRFILVARLATLRAGKGAGRSVKIRRAAGNRRACEGFGLLLGKRSGGTPGNKQSKHDP